MEIKLNVLFYTDKATIVDNAFVDILKVADFMRQYPNVTVVIEGHTDDRASIAHNQKLSQRRRKLFIENSFVLALMLDVC